MPAKRIIAAALFGTSVVACSPNAVPPEIGGTAAGTVLDNRIDAKLNDEDKRRAYAAQIKALETGPSGAPVSWRNPDSGHYGDVVPGPAYQANGAACRQFTHTIFIDGKPQSERSTACRNTGNTWSVVN
jgi:surface antigen